MPKMNPADGSTEHRLSGKESENVSAALRSSTGTYSAAPAFHSDDVQHVANYRALSVLAIFSLLIGLASSLSLLAKGFLLLPLSGLAVALLALRRIALSDGRLAGRGTAIAGLVLCVAFGAAALTRDAVSRYLRTSQAEEFAAQWLALVASNETAQAFKATYEGARPPAPPEPGVPPPTKTPYDAFLSDPLIQQIVAAGDDATIQYVDTLEFAPQSRQVVVVRQQFSVVPADSEKTSHARPTQVVLTLQRASFRGDRDKRWLVMRHEAPSSADN
jgi:hypothetical protein